jgi:single-strand DNA-binding protein
MDGLNQVTLVGSVGKDAETKFIGENSQVAKFGLATNRSYKDKTGEKQTQTEWHNIEVWGDTAKFAGQYVKKGQLVLVTGEIRYEKFDDKDGKPQQRTKIVANKIQLFPKGGNGEAKSEIAGAAKETEAYAAEAEPSNSSSSNDDLPF